ncbi:MAG: hypothetical protein KC766_25170 [Myxococcales bacterium]|nr:hypothetical protein [Myxococcales bacterium]
MKPATKALSALLLTLGGCAGNQASALPPGSAGGSIHAATTNRPPDTPDAEATPHAPPDEARAPSPRAAPVEVVGVGSPRSFVRLENALVVFLATGNDDDVASPLLLHAGKATRFDALLGGKEFVAGLWGFEGRYPSDLYARISDSTQAGDKTTAAHLVGAKWRPVRTKLDLHRSPLWSPPGYTRQPAAPSLTAGCDHAVTAVLWTQQVNESGGAASGMRVSLGERCSTLADVASDAPYAIELWPDSGSKSEIQVLPVPLGSRIIGGGMAGSTLILGYQNGPEAKIFLWDTEARSATDISGVPAGLTSMCVQRGGELWATGGGSLWNYSAGRWIELVLPDFAGTAARPEQVACLGEDIAVIASAGAAGLLRAATGLVYWSGQHQGVMSASFLDELPEGVEEMK